MTILENPLKIELVYTSYNSHQTAPLAFLFDSFFATISNQNSLLKPYFHLRQLINAEQHRQLCP